MPQATVPAIRAAVEKAIERLAGRRDVLKTALTEVEDELKRLLAMLRASGAEAEKGAIERMTGRGPSDVEVAVNRLLAREPHKITAAQLAQETGQSVKNAGQALARMRRLGKIRRAGRGVYAAKKKVS